MNAQLAILFTAILREISNNDIINRELVHKLVDSCFDVRDNIQKSIDELV